MPTMMSVHEAKANFSSVLSEVEDKLAVITIMRYGRPVARIVPVAPQRNMSPLPEIHKDQADRFIIATALFNDFKVVTGDRRFAEYGVETIV